MALVLAVSRRRDGLKAALDPLRRLAVIGVITAAIASTTWLPFLLRAAHEPVSNTGSAYHYLPADGAELTFPMLKFTLLGALCLLGTLLLVVRARSSARPRIWRQSRRAASRPTRAATCSASAWCCTAWPPASCPSAGPTPWPFSCHWRWTRLGRRASSVRDEPLREAFWDDVLDFLTDEFVAAVAELLFRLHIQQDDGPILIHDYHGVRGGFQQAVVSRLHLHEVPISYGIGWEGHNRECIAGVRCGRHNRRDRWFHSVSKEGELCKTVTVQFLAQAPLRLCKIEDRTNML